MMKEIEAEKAKMKAKGCTHFAFIAIHPEMGGDDYFIMLYAEGEITDSMIRKEIIKNGGCVFNDHTRGEL